MAAIVEGQIHMTIALSERLVEEPSEDQEKRIVYGACATSTRWKYTSVYTAYG
jgi:hypothetical protein